VIYVRPAFIMMQNCFRSKSAPSPRKDGLASGFTVSDSDVDSDKSSDVDDSDGNSGYENRRSSSDGSSED